MNDLAATGNLIEAGLWFAIALSMLLQRFRSKRRLRRVLGLLSGAFLVFGLSDLVEAQTGAWWSPFWLLLLKAACLIAFAFGFREYYRIRRLPDA